MTEMSDSLYELTFGEPKKPESGPHYHINKVIKAAGNTFWDNVQFLLVKHWHVEFKRLFAASHIDKKFEQYVLWEIVTAKPQELPEMPKQVLGQFRKARDLIFASGIVGAGIKVKTPPGDEIEWVNFQIYGIMIGLKRWVAKEGRAWVIRSYYMAIKKHAPAGLEVWKQKWPNVTLEQAHDQLDLRLALEIKKSHAMFFKDQAMLAGIALSYMPELFK